MQFNYMLRFGEIGTKGKNRGLFEECLKRNIRTLLKRQAGDAFSLKSVRGRIFVEAEKPVSLKTVFGLVSYSPVVSCSPSIDSIKQVIADNLLHLFDGKSFRVDVKRIDKSFPMTSPEIEAALGNFICSRTGSRVELKSKENILGVEIHKEFAYVFSESTSCFGGLPVGIEGNVLLFLDKEHSAERLAVAGLLMMKRGCAIIPVLMAYQGEPDAGLLSLLQAYSPQQITPIAAESLNELEAIARKHNAEGITIAQCIDDYTDAGTSLAQFRPLVGLLGDQIISLFVNFSAATRTGNKNDKN